MSDKKNIVKKKYNNITYMENIEHLIIIRFSCYFPERSEMEKDKKKLLDRNRLNLRFELFEKFCLWSLVHQTTKNFKIIIVYDKDLHKIYVDRLKSLIELYDFIIMHKWDTEYKLHENKWLQCYIDKNKKYLITTRIDDDDIINLRLNEMFYKLFVYNLRKYGSYNNSLISFKGGKFIYKNKERFQIAPCNYPTAAIFLSYCSSINDSQNIYARDHAEIEFDKKMRIYRFPNCWGILNHEFNNDSTRRTRMFRKEQTEDIQYKKIYDLFSSPSDYNKGPFQ